MDTNALMMPVECDLRVFEEVERLLAETAGSGGGVRYLVPEPVVEELRSLADGGGTEGIAASVGLDLVDRCRVVATEASYADDAVVELASRADLVVTNDRPLRDRLLSRDVSVIGLSGENTLVVTRPS